MSKRKVYFFICIASMVLITAFYGIHLFTNKYAIQEINNKNSNSKIYFSAKLINKNIFGVTQKHNFFQTKILDIGSDLLYYPELIQLRKDRWIILIHKESISVYSLEKEKNYEFNVPNKNIISACVSTLDNNTNNILLLLSKTDEKYAEDLMIISILENNNSLQFKMICKKSLKEMKPWKIQTCDVDGDGKKEISIGMYKTTPFHPILAKRPFVYSWDGNRIAPKWLGSRLSKPFEDYLFLDLNHDEKDELVSIEKLESGKMVVSAYTWRGFGFEIIGESSEFEEILEIKKCDNDNKKLMIKAKYKNNLSNYYIEFMDGVLIAKKEVN